MDYTEFKSSYPHQYIRASEEPEEYYSIGSFWDYSVKSPTKKGHTDHTFYGFMIGKGGIECVSPGSWDEPPHYEVFEYETIIVRPKLKFPKR